MKWSFKIATVSGIPIYAHGTFVLLIAFFVIRDLSAGATLAAALGSALFVLAIFATVVLHELGHALTARRFGIRTRDITLLPIGGLARLERLPDVPRQELWVALAGPAVNLAIAAGLFAIATVVGVRIDAFAIGSHDGDVVSRFIAINVWLAVFNLIPAFPMDGGRALRAILAERLEYTRATEIAASMGQGLALLFGFIGLFTNPFLLFIALFVWMGASAEASTVALRSAIAGIPVSRAMMTDFRALAATDTLQRAADWVIAGWQQNFPVLEGEKLVGILTREGLVRVLTERGPGTEVREAMTSRFETADVRDMLEQALGRLQSGGCPVLPVTQNGRLVGLLTADNVGEFVMLRSAVARH